MADTVIAALILSSHQTKLLRYRKNHIKILCIFYGKYTVDMI